MPAPTAHAWEGKAVVAYHSLEDAIVKDYAARACGASTGGDPPAFRSVTRRCVLPSPEEVAANIRARSARLRVLERTDAPVP
jgi:16S rRNA (cytosine1402-N4)-methyltransferase